MVFLHHYRDHVGGTHVYPLPSPYTHTHTPHLLLLFQSNVTQLGQTQHARRSRNISDLKLFYCHYVIKIRLVVITAGPS